MVGGHGFKGSDLPAIALAQARRAGVQGSILVPGPHLDSVFTRKAQIYLTSFKI